MAVLQAAWWKRHTVTAICDQRDESAEIRVRCNEGEMERRGEGWEGLGNDLTQLTSKIFFATECCL